MMRKGKSLNKRLNMLLAVSVVPFSIMTIYLLFMVQQLSERYDAIVDNITHANEYNIHFKEDVDYTMYVIVVNSERAEELVDTKKPHELITQARDTFQTLWGQADNSYAKSMLTRIVKSLDTLEDRVEEIEKDARVSGMYDKNLERLDLNVRVLTELIQEQIQEYIYYETTNLEALRVNVRKDAANALRISMVVFAAILIGELFLSRKISGHLTEGIQQLRLVTRKAGHGDFKVRAQLSDSDEELAELGEGFNQMVERIGNLVEDIRVEQLNLRATEQKLLQAQINPHFLYNTLDAIIWLAEAGQTEQVIMMVSALSDFFRTTLSKGRDYITVQEEESHIRSYLKIQQFRYQDILEYEIDIPKEMYRYQILKLTLQPLVENALYHGIKNKRGKGHIRVTGQLEGGRLVFKVSDDGMGMTPERLAQVRKAMNKGDEDISGDPSGFGLFNVVQRIKLNYGAEYGLWITSVYQEGTEIQVEIPAINNEPNSKNI
ncbi:MAG: histidine kinase [Eubacteriales bacterium]|nr:histidine kinase [Eubacteriales bacterium]